ncbi:hypothetical protein P154DRAFT_355700 [Amniculicola lignicola CBS 123094]|uniref:Rhodopsin domain-containing protein n=1 Tax=Amniculicola lignicola CBS 123094 TaxID=1392246 RepID=A0A6A5WUG2_9PLEO|nr:hypothetical protein P154DRAFT_355700 [Amniculicola lignicola CBS 123094]
MAKSDASLEAESQAPLIYSLSIIFVTLSTASVFLRIYTRKRILNIFGADDITITVAQVLAIAVSVTTILEVVWGLGRHTKFVPGDDATKQLKSLYANIMIYNASQILTKISFLIQYRRLFPSDSIQRICFWFLLFIVVWGIVQEFIVSFSCMPLTAFTPKMVNKCIDSLPVWYLTSCMNIVTDFIIFAIPVVPVAKLQMRARQKVLLLGLFCLGFFTCIISLVRLSTLHKGVNTQDPFWDNAPAAYWSVVELNCGILCACLPTLRPLIQKIIPKLLTTRGDSGRTNTASSHKFSTLGKKSRNDSHATDNSIYIQKEIELRSTSELKSNAAYAHSLEEDSVESQTVVHSFAGRQLKGP